MTNSQPHHDNPTKPQLKYLRDLATATGGTFSWPQTFEEASKEIVRLEETKRTSRSDRRRETQEVGRDMAVGRGGGARVRDDELAGYGSNCRWLHQTRD
jgi:hypothetical protein